MFPIPLYQIALHPRTQMAVPTVRFNMRIIMRLYNNDRDGNQATYICLLVKTFVAGGGTFFYPPLIDLQYASHEIITQFQSNTVLSNKLLCYKHVIEGTVGSVPICFGLAELSPSTYEQAMDDPGW